MSTAFLHQNRRVGLGNRATMIKKETLLYAAAVAIGVVVWIAVSRATNKREAWDSEVYFSVGMPIVCFAAFVLGMIEPRRAWRWGVAPLVGQLVAMLVTQGIGNLLPLGVIVFAVLSLPSVLTARLGAFVRDRWLRRNAT